MPKVVLEFEVTDKGTAVVRQVAGEVDKAMSRVKAGNESLALSTGRADEAVRDFSRGAKSFGILLLSDLNPALAQSIMSFQMMARTSALASSAITGGLVLAAAAGVTALLHFTTKTNEAIEFQTRLNESVRRFDLSGMTSQLKAVGLELEVEEKKAKAFLGGFKMAGGFEGFAGFEPDEAGSLGLGLADSRLKKLRERQAQVRKEIERITPMFFEQEIVGLASKIRSAQSERSLLAGPTAARGTEMEDRLQRELRDAKRIIDLQAEIAKGQAASDEERTRISTLASFKRLAVEEETKTKILAGQREIAAQTLTDQTADLRQRSAIRGALAGEDQGKQLAEARRLHAQLLALLDGHFAQGLMSEREYQGQRRDLQSQWVTTNAAALAKATADHKQFTEKIKELDRQMREAKTGTEDLLAGIKQAGMSPAESFADRERRAQEKLGRAMSLSGQEQIDALKAIQQEYSALALEAKRSAETQVAAAKETTKAWVSEMPGAAFQSKPGQTSEAWKAFFGKTGSEVVASSPGKVTDLWWMRADTKESLKPWWERADVQEKLKPWWERAPEPKALGEVKALADKVTDIGKKIQESYSTAKSEVEVSAGAAKRLADETTRNLEALTKSVSAADALAGAYQAAAAAAQALAAAALSLPSGASGGGGVSSFANEFGSAVTRVDRSSPDFVPGVTGVVTIVGPSEGGEGFQHGGWVPGPIGAPRPIVAHGGELVLNREQQGTLRGHTFNLNLTVNGGLHGLDEGGLRRLVRDKIMPEVERALG